MKNGVSEEFPFGPDTLVYKVYGKAFALAGLDEVPGSCNLKCDPERAEL
jgi:predicted DNA-binding protein (MmcQ/YjbR family)